MKELLLFTILLLIAGCSAPKEPPAAEVREVDSLLALSSQYNLAIDTEASFRYSLEALEPAKSAGYRKGIARAYYLIGNALYNTGNYDKSMEYISLGEEYADGDVQRLSEFIRIRARIYAYLGLHEKSKNEFLKGLSYIKQIKKREDREFLTALAYEPEPLPAGVICTFRKTQIRQKSPHPVDKRGETTGTKTGKTFHYPGSVDFIAIGIYDFCLVAGKTKRIYPRAPGNQSEDTTERTASVFTYLSAIYDQRNRRLLVSFRKNHPEPEKQPS